MTPPAPTRPMSVQTPAAGVSVPVATIAKEASQPPQAVAGSPSNDQDPYQVTTPTQAASTPDHSDVGERAVSNPLRKFSLLGHGLEVAARAQNQTPLLGSICLAGQASIWFAEPNTGKTLMCLKLLIDAIGEKLIEPTNVYYVNVDDSSSGLSTKLNILQEYGVHVLAEGYRGFRAQDLVHDIERMITQNLAKGQFIILDTLKKFVSVIDKKASSHFADLLRRFVLKGGTVLCLAHTNKRRNAEGKPIYGGTSDFVDDFDCSYIISSVTPDASPNERTIMFDCNKRRGDVAQRVYYTYGIEDGLSYEAMLASVRPADPDRFNATDADAAPSDTDLIEAVKGHLQHGVTTKMKLAAGVAKMARTSQRAALRVIDKYTGNDPAFHHWDYDVQARGAKVFVLLNREVPVAAEAPVPTD